VLTFLLSLCVLGYTHILPLSVTLGLGGAGSLIAIVGFMDDHGHIAARWRLLGHFSAAVWALFWLGGLPTLHVVGVDINFGWIGHILAAFYLVWMLNLYNFMDGIDGIASVQAICACLGACLIYWLVGVDYLIWVPFILAMAVAGFLFWNFPPARIFMGDAGSGFLGIVLGIISIQAAWASSQLLWAWLILLGVFIVDATYTLFRRLLRGDKVYEAHRSHAYQYASRSVGTHRPVTLAVGAICLIWLLPWALAVTLLHLDGLMCLLLAYSPLIAIAIKFHAGELEKVV
jgi:Fuc2NAc and GlcNAc transferase